MQRTAEHKPNLLANRETS